MEDTVTKTPFAFATIECILSIALLTIHFYEVRSSEGDMRLTLTIP